MTHFLSKTDIIDADDVQYEEIDVPEWGGRVRVKGLSGTERDSFEESLHTGKGKARRVSLANFRAKLAVRTVVDGDGRRVFEDSDYGLLGAKSASGLAKIAELASRLSGLSEADVEELADEMGNDPSDDSSLN